MPQQKTGTMTSRERLLAAYARKPVDRIPCSPRVWAWMQEYYGDVRRETLLRMADEFGFDPHAVVGVHTHPTGLTPRADFDLPARAGIRGGEPGRRPACRATRCTPQAARSICTTTASSCPWPT